MVNMDNAEEVMQILERFTRLKQKEIPKELDDYLQYVAKTGDTVFQWANLKYLFREKLLNVIKHFHDTTPLCDDEIPQYPNVDAFNYESMKTSLLERLEHFNAAPFTIQRLCELLIEPRKQYNRLDKFMRALEKNILVVSTTEPGRKRAEESENGDSLDSVTNGDVSLDVNVDIDMEGDGIFNAEAQNGNGTTSTAASATTASATAAPAAAATTEAKKEEAPASAAGTNSNANDVVEPNAAVTHKADDDDILPNPKKAKMDVPDGDAAEAKPDAAVDATTVKAVELSSKEDAVMQSETEEKPAKVADAEIKDEEKKSEDIKAAEQPQKDVDMAESSDKVEEKPTAVEPAKEEPLAEKNTNNDETDKAAVMTESPIKESKLEKNEPKLAAVENGKDDEAKENIKDSVNGVDIVANHAEQEVKVEVAAAKDVAEAPEKVLELNNVEDKQIIDEKTKEEITAADKIEVPVEKVEANEANNDKPAAEAVAETVAENEKSEVANEESKAETASDKELETAEVSAPLLDDESTKSAGEETLKEDKIADAVVADEKTEAASDAKPAGEAEQVAAIETASAEEAVKVAEAELAKPVESAESKASAEAKDVAVASETAAAELPKEAVADAAESKTTAAVAAEAAEAAVPDVTTPLAENAATTPTTVPILAINDQPMDENIADIALEVASDIGISIPEVASSALPVDEVIMAETNSEMATDAAMEGAKEEEPAGMEVDDTSQEAMDQ